MLCNEVKIEELVINNTHNPITYDTGKSKIIINPIYNENNGKPLFKILLDIMKNDAENLCK